MKVTMPFGLFGGARISSATSNRAWPGHFPGFWGANRQAERPGALGPTSLPTAFGQPQSGISTRSGGQRCVSRMAAGKAGSS